MGGDDLNVLGIVVLDHEHARRSGKDESEALALERLDRLDGEIDIESDFEDVLLIGKDIGRLAEDFLGISVVGAFGIEDDAAIPEIVRRTWEFLSSAEEMILTLSAAAKNSSVSTVTE